MKNKEFIIAQPRKKVLNHSWIPLIGFRQHQCSKCKCHKWWDPATQRIMYQDRFGKITYRSPDCVLPNTKL